MSKSYLNKILCLILGLIVLIVVTGVIGLRKMRRWLKVREFHVVAANAEIVELTKLLEDDPSLANIRGDAGSTAIHWVSLQGSILPDELGDSTFCINLLNFDTEGDYVSAAKLLLSHGADVYVTGRGGWTPLHLAAAYGRQPDLVRLLVESGAEVSARDDLGRTPLDRARENDRMQIVEYLGSLSQATSGLLQASDSNFAFHAPEDKEGELYSDARLSFKLPPRMRITGANAEGGVYSIMRPRDEFLITIMVLDSITTQYFESDIPNVKRSDKQTKRTFLGSVVYGRNKGICRSIDSYTREGKLFSRSYDLCLESNGRKIHVGLLGSDGSSETLEFDPNDFRPFLESINVK